jgi:hypothetical protein
MKLLNWKAQMALECMFAMQLDFVARVEVEGGLELQHAESGLVQSGHW